MNKKKIYPWYFAVGALIVYTGLFVLPGVIGIAYSLTDWSAYSKELHFVGLDNYKAILVDSKDLYRYISNTLIFTVITTIAKTILGLALAIVLSRDVAWKNLHRGIMYIPSVVSIIITGMVFSSILNPRKGVLNIFLESIGLDFFALKWLTDPDIAFSAVMGVDVWRGTGYVMTILIAGILAISKTYYEAASIDGANNWQQFRNITLPLLKPTIAVVIVLNVIYGLKIFDMVYVLTNGGPGHATEVMNTAVFKLFSKGLFAQGTAISSIMFVLMVITGFFMVKILMLGEVKE